MNFHNCKIAINSSGIVADNASLDIGNNLLPVYGVGKIGNKLQTPDGPIRNTFKFSYFPQLEHEPNFPIVSGIKALLNDGNFVPTTIILAGITGYNCYLSDLSLQAEPNDLVKSNVSFVSFEPVSGNIATGQTQVDVDSVSYGWATYVLSGNEYLLVPTFNFNYNFNANWEPIYVLGRKTPIEVKLINGAEKISLERDVFYNPTFSGQNSSQMFLNYSGENHYAEVKNLSIICETEGFGAAAAGLATLKIDVSGAVIRNSQIKGRIDDIVRIDTTIEKYF